MDPHDLTLADCFHAHYHVTVWCAARCPGRTLPLDRLGRWADRKVLDLARQGVLVCERCRAKVGRVHIGSTTRADPVLSWSPSDDATPGRET